MKKHIHLILLFAILAVGIFVRVYDFGNTPYGLNQDEASLGYDAWADMTYGMDRNGDHNSIYPVAWGSGQNVLYNYVARPFISILGLNILSVRLPMLLFNVAAMVVFYLFCQYLFGDKVALLSLFILATCPWHIIASRWGLESNFAIPIVMFAMYCFARIKDNDIWFIPAAGLLAFLMYAYSAHLFFIAAFAIAIGIYLIVKKMVSIKNMIIGAAAFLIVCLPMAVFLVVNIFEFEPTRFMGFAIPNFGMMRSEETLNLWGDYGGERVFFQSLSSNIMLLKNVALKYTGFNLHNAPSQFGAIYKFMMPFMLIGISLSISKIKTKNYGVILICLWLLCALFQNLFMESNIIRMNIGFLPIIIFISMGIIWISEKIKGTIPVFLVITVFSFVAFCGYYFNNFNNDTSYAFYGGFDDAIEYATDNSSGGDIYLTEKGNAPYIIALFTEKTPPAVFASSAQYENYDWQFRDVVRYQNYISGIPETIQPIAGDAYIYQAKEEIEPILMNPDNEICFFGNYTLIIVK